MAEIQFGKVRGMVERELDWGDPQFRERYFRQVVKEIQESWDSRDVRFRNFRVQTNGTLKRAQALGMMLQLTDEEMGEIGARLAAGERPFRISKAMKGIPYALVFWIYKWRKGRIERERKRMQSARERFEGLSEAVLAKMELKAKDKEFMASMSIQDQAVWLRACREEVEKRREWEQTGSGMTMKIVSDYPWLKDGESPKELEGVLEAGAIRESFKKEDDAEKA